MKVQSDELPGGLEDIRHTENTGLIDLSHKVLDSWKRITKLDWVGLSLIHI